MTNTSAQPREGGDKDGQPVVHFEVIGKEAEKHVVVPDVEAALAKAESLGGTRMMGPDKVMEGVETGLFDDPEGDVVGVVNEAT